jgi:hypothetical protein
MVTLFVEGFSHFTGITQLCSNSNHLNFHLLKQGGISSIIFLLVCIKLTRVQHTNSTDLKICNICMTHQLPHCGLNWWTMFVTGLWRDFWHQSGLPLDMDDSTCKNWVFKKSDTWVVCRDWELEVLKAPLGLKSCQTLNLHTLPYMHMISSCFKTTSVVGIVHNNPSHFYILPNVEFCRENACINISTQASSIPTLRLCTKWNLPKHCCKLQLRL